MSPQKSQVLFVGIDIAARSFSAAWGTDPKQIVPTQTFPQTRAGRSKLLRALEAVGFPPDRVQVVMEATGTYWMQVAVALYQADYRVSVLNPRQVYHFAEALNRQAKTDAIDAQMLAFLAQSLPVTDWIPPSAAWEAIYQRLVEHDNLTEIRQMLRNQLHALSQRSQVDPAVVARKQQLIDSFDAQIKAINKELGIWLDMSEWASQVQCLLTIKGIGLLSTAWLLILTNGFSTCEDAEQLASYLGLVPHPLHSGSSRRSHRRVGHSGHARARRVLHQAAVSAAQYNPAVKAFYHRLLSNGKSVKLARCAAARKLVHIVFGVATSGKPFDPAYHLAHSQPTAA